MIDTLLIGLKHTKNQMLLADRLQRKYQIRFVKNLPRDLASSFDLCILDLTFVRQYVDHIKVCRQQAEPLFLPFLLILSHQELVNTKAEYLRQLVDDVLVAPVDLLELGLRLESMLRPRRLSLKMQAILEAEQQLEAQLQTANEILHQHATQDGLTGLANRRRFDEALDYEFDRARRTQTLLHLVMCDIDHFKAYNDTYGHLQGDVCLRKVAEILQTSVHRPPDLVARYGGEEFVIILPNTTAAGTQHVVQHLQQTIQQAQLPHCSSPTAHYVTISFGIAGLVPAIDNRPEDLIALADQALYEAKAQGRDTVVYRSVEAAAPKDSAE